MNPLLTVSEFDSDASEPLLLCVLPSVTGEVRFAVPAIYLELVREFDGARSVDEAIDAFLARSPPGRFAKSWLQKLVEQSLLPKGILVYEDQDPARVAVSRQATRGFLNLKVPIFKPAVVDPLAKRLGFLLRREALIVGLILFIASHAYVYGTLIQGQHLDFNKMSVLGIVALMWLSTAGTLFHELGHASAAALYGCRNTTIGWGLYLIYTVMWTNVSEAWRLPRRQRALIDIAGIHFQGFFLLLLLLIYLYTHDTLFLFAFVFIDLSIAANFNPFLRMDGYWLMSDLFGIVNLRHQQVVWLQSLGARFLWRRAAPVQCNLKPRARLALGIYTVLGTLFVVHVTVVIFKVVVLTVLKEYPGLLRDSWRHLSEGMSALEMLRTFLEISWRTMLLLGAVLTVLNLAKRGMRLAARLGVVKAAQQASI